MLHDPEMEFMGAGEPSPAGHASQPEIDGTHREIQDAGNLLGGLAEGMERQDLALPKSQSLRSAQKCLTTICSF